METTKYNERKLINIQVHREIKRKLEIESVKHHVSVPKLVRRIIDSYYEQERIQVFPESFIIGVDLYNQTVLHLNIAADIHAKIKNEAYSLDIGIGDLMRNILYAYCEKHLFSIPEFEKEMQSRVSVTLPIKSISKLRYEAQKEKLTISQYIQLIIENHYNNNGQIQSFVSTKRIPKKPMSIYLNQSLYEKIKNDSLELNTSVSAIIRNILMVHYSEDFPEVIFNPETVGTVHLNLTLPKQMIDEVKNDVSFGTNSVSSKINEIVGKYYENMGG